MKKLMLVMAVLVTACLATSIYAQAPAPQAPATPATPQTQAKPAAEPAKPAPAVVPAKKTVTPKIVGEVVAVDTTANTITVKNNAGKSETLNVEAKVVIKKAGKTCTLTDIAAGDKVIVKYRTEGDKKTVTSITASAPLLKK